MGVFVFFVFGLAASEDCPTPEFTPLGVTAHIKHTNLATEKGVYIDLENIYCAPSQSKNGGCDQGYHEHQQILLTSDSQQTFERARPSTQTGNEGLLPLYVTLISFRTNDYGNYIDCPKKIYSDVDEVLVRFDALKRRCT